MAIKIGDAVVQLLIDTGHLDEGFDKAQRKAKDTGVAATQSFGSFGAAVQRVEGFVRGLGIALAALAIAKVFREGARAALDFNRAFTEVSTIVNTRTPQGRAQLAALRQQILDLNPALGSAKDLTQGLYEALSAGAEPAEAVALVAEAARFARAALTDTRTAMDILTTVLNAYGESAENADKISSSLFKTIELGKTRGEELAGALGRVIPIAATMGVNLNQVNAAIATLTVGGISTEEAVVALRQALLSILSPSSEAEKLATQMGISFKQMREEIKTRGLAAVLGELAEKTRGNSEATTTFFGNVRALIAILALTGPQAEQYGKILTEIEKAYAEATATGEAFDKQTQSVTGRFDTLSNTIENRVIVAADRLAPVAENLLDFLERGAQRGSTLDLVLEVVSKTILAGAVAVTVLAKAVNNVFAVSAGFNAFLLEHLITLTEWVGKFFDVGNAVGFLRDRLNFFNEVQGNFEESAEANNRSLDKLLDGWADAGSSKLPQLEKASGKAKIKLDELDKTTENLGKSTARAIDKFDELALKLDPQIIEAFKQGNEEMLRLLDTLDRSVPAAQRGSEAFAGLLRLFLPAEVQNIIAAREALEALGIEGSTAIQEKLTKTEEAFQKLKDTGLATQHELLQGEIQITELRLELHRQLGEDIGEEELERLERLRQKLAEIRGEAETGGEAAKMWGEIWKEVITSSQNPMEQLGQIGAQAFNNLRGAMAQWVTAAILGSSSIGKALKTALAQVLAQIAAEAAIRGLFALAYGFLMLAQLRFKEAGDAFTSAGIFFAVAAAAGAGARAIAPKGQRAAGIVGPGGGPGGVIVGPEEQGPVTVERRQFAEGGLVTRPTLALLGEAGPELVVPLSGGGEPLPSLAGGIGTTITMNIGGVVSDDTLLDIMERMSDLVEASDATLVSSSARTVVRRS